MTPERIDLTHEVGGWAKPTQPGSQARDLSTVVLHIVSAPRQTYDGLTASTQPTANIHQDIRRLSHDQCELNLRDKTVMGQRTKHEHVR